MDYREASVQISATTGVSLRPASDEDLRTLASLGAPDSIVSFYRNYEPDTEAEIGKVRLWPIADILVENKDAVPGADLHPHGFVTFATTIYGDAYCFDTSVPESARDAPVVIMTHEVIFEGLDPEVIMAARKRVANDFGDFLARFISESLDVKPAYPRQ